MGKILQFPLQQVALQHEAEKLKEVSDKIDSIILDSLDDQEVEPYEIAGILAHRLGSLMRNMNQKNKIWDVCEKVLKKQAIID